MFAAVFGGALPCACALAPPFANAAGWSIRSDNDYYNFWEAPAERPDFGYTDGNRFTWMPDGVPRVLRRVAPLWMFGEPGGALRSDWGIEQTIYTPWRLPPDRPYAGWLEVFGTLRTEPEFGLRRMTLHVGVAGPPSYGEQTQRWIHRQFGFGAPPDWTFQYPAELGVTLEGEGAWSTVNLGEPDRFGLRAGPRVRIRIGNMNDDARAGIAGAIGWDPTPPWSQGHAAKKLAIYLTGAVHADLIARDSFLEGPFFNDGDAVQDVRRIVGEAQTGIAVQFRQARFEYRIMRRSKEYEAQPTPHTYSSLMFTWTGNR